MEIKEIFRSKDKVYSMSNAEEYWCNEQQLINDDGEYSKEEFDKNIRYEVGKFFRTTENIVVLMGAGASVVGNQDKNYGHTVAMLASEIDLQLKKEANYYTLNEIIQKVNYKEQFSEENKKFNLEDLLSKIEMYFNFIEDEVGSEEDKKFKETYTKIKKIIKDKTSYDYTPIAFKHVGFIKLLTEMHTAPNRLSIITTNYDTVIEDAANAANFTVFDGFTFTHKPVFDISMFDWLLAKPISNVKSNKLEYKKQVLNILKIHGSLTWQREGETIIRKSKNDIKDPIMIFPSSSKYMHSYEEPYFELFTKFQELLRKPNTLLITTGFSFADNHISKMITQAIRTTPSLSLLVTDYSISPDEPNSNWKDITTLMEQGYDIGFLEATMNGDLTKYISKDRV